MLAKQTTTATETGTAAELIAELANRRPADFTPADVEQLFGIAVRAHGYLNDAGIPTAVLAGGHGISPTDVVRVASGLLAGAGLEPFELALWNSFGGLPPTAN